MKLHAWRSTINNPCDAPQVFISLRIESKVTDVYPWVLPLEIARELLGAVVESITEDPVEVEVTMKLKEGIRT